MATDLVYVQGDGLCAICPCSHECDRGGPPRVCYVTERPVMGYPAKEPSEIGTMQVRVFADLFPSEHWRFAFGSVADSSEEAE